MNDSVDFTSAQHAFKTFFNSEQQVNTPQDNSAPQQNEAFNNVVQQVKENQTPPSKQIHKVTPDAMTDTETMSVTEAEKEVNKKKTFDEVLKDLDIKYSELFVVIDSFLQNGFHIETHKIKQLEFTFKTKNVRSIGTINDALDGSKYTMAQAAGQLLLERSLAASLFSFKQGSGPVTFFNHDTDEDDEAALAFVRKLSAPIYNIMSNKLKRFELVTTLASRDEALDHFLAHQQD